MAPERYRLLLSRFATGVSVATTLDAAGRPCGMTASAISAVSLSPPILAVCVDRSADFHGTLAGAARFALSVLASDQEHLSLRFAAELNDRFAGVGVRSGPYGLPLLEQAVAHILCQKAGAMAVGDHTVFLGLVTGGETFDRAPLVHFRGSYATTGPA